MSYNLFLDDERSPNDIWGQTKNPDYVVYNWITVKSYKEFTDHLDSKGLPGKVSFDGFLGEESEYTGYDCALYLVEYCIDHDLELPKYYIHTDVNDDRKQITDLLKKFAAYQKKSSKKKG